MRVRHFWVVDYYGERYALTVRSHGLHSIAGLGYKEEAIYQRVGEQFALVDRGFEQGEVSGAVFFPEPGAYDAYYRFVQFCQNTPLTLEYAPVVKRGVPVRTFLRTVSLAEIEKTELTVGGLNCAVRFICTTPWYEISRYETEIREYDGKRYNYTYDYRYGGRAPNTVTFNLDTHMASPMRIRINGPCTSPVWRHFVANDLVGEGKLNATIGRGRYALIDPTVVPYEMKEYYNDGRVYRDLYALSDFSTKRFLYGQHGENTVTLSHASLEKVKMYVEVHSYYASV